MNVTLYKYTGEKNQVDKSSSLTLQLSTSGKFKDDISIFTPHLILDISNAGGIDFNYVYIQEFARYYFVTDLVVLSGSLVDVSLRVDPLYSFSSDIYDSQGLILRCEEFSNPLLIDRERPIQGTPEITLSLVDTTGSNVTFDVNMSNSTFSYIVTTIRKEFNPFTETPADKRYNGISPMEWTNIAMGACMPSVETAYQSQMGDSVNHWICNRRYVNELAKYALDAGLQYSEYFLSIVSFPFEITSTLGQDTTDVIIYVTNSGPINVFSPGGAWQTDSRNYSKRYKYGGVMPYLILFKTQLIGTPSSFLDMEPFTTYELYIPYYGWVNLPVKEYAGKTITCFYSVSTYDGNGQVSLVSGDNMLFSASVNLGTPISLTKDNSEEIARNNLSRGTSMAIGFLTGIMGAAVAGASGNPAVAGLGLASAIGSVASGSVDLVTHQIKYTQAGSVGNRTALESPHSAYIRKTQYKPVFSSNQYNSEYLLYKHEYGEPYERVELLGDVEGFAKVDKCNLTLPTGTETEMNWILEALRDGVIL